MRRSIIVICCLCLLLAFAMPAFAAEDVNFTVTATQTTATRGDVIDVTVKIESGKAFTALGFKLDFDASEFEYVAQSGKAHADIPNSFIVNYDESKLAFGLASLSGGATYSGELLRFQLKVKSTAQFSEATISVKEITVTGASHGVTGAKITCKHSYTTWTKVDDNTHESKCDMCGTPTTAAHSWDNGTVTKGSGCDAPGEKTYKCTASGCGATKVEPVAKTGHSWDNDCDTECNNGCGTTREVKHKYSDKYSHDEKQHWYACTVCGAKNAETLYDHTPDRDAPTEKDAQLCKYCGYVIKDKLPHEHVVSDQIQKDAEGHWYYCSTVGCYMRIDLTAHVYDNECDIDCNVCAYIRIPPHNYKPEWRGGQEGHWRVCALCNAESEVLPHTPGAPATEEDPQMCEDCLYWIQWPLSHQCTYNEEWEQDEEGHWQCCTECMNCSEAQAHTWDEGTVTLQPTHTEEGVKTFYCTVCRAEKTETIPVLDETETVPPTTAPPQMPSAPAEEDGFPWWVIGAAAGVLLVIGIVLLVIELIRSRKTNMHGKFSK